MSTEEEPKSFRLTARDTDIIEHVARFRMTTVQVLTRLYFGNKRESENAAVKVTLRLRQASYLAAHPLLERTLYFVPGPAATPNDRTAGGPLTNQVLIPCYAALMVCNAVEEDAVYIPQSDHRRLFAENGLGDSFVHPQLHYYLDHPSGIGPRLVAIRVDYRRDCRSLVSRTHQVLNAHMKREAFRNLVEAKRFAVTVATGSVRKRDRIQAMYDKNPNNGIPLRTVFVDDLDELIATKDRRAK